MNMPLPKSARKTVAKAVANASPVPTFALSDGTTRTTALHDYGRTVRDEPFHYIYKHRIFVKDNAVSPQDVAAWLRDRYTRMRAGHRYRVKTFKAVDGHSYVDCIYMETCSDADLTYIKLKWGFSEVKVNRGNRLPRRKLSPEQRARLKAALKATEDAFFESLST